MLILNKKKINFMVAAIYLTVFIAAICFFHKGAFETLEARLIDFNFNRRGPLRADNKIIIVGFTDACISAIGKWPWKRDIHASVIDKIADAGARVIAVDVLFQDPGATAAEDEKLIKTLTKNKNIVLSAVIAPKKIYQDGAFIDTRHVILPFGELADKSGGAGFISVNYDALNPDGILRSAILTDKDENGGTLNSFAMKIAELSGLAKIKTDSGQKYYINYYGPAKTFEYLSFSKIYSCEVELNYFKDKIVLIGPLATALGDLHHTPYGTMPGTEVQANILNCAISSSFLKRISPFTMFLICAVSMILCAYPMVKYGVSYSAAACAIISALMIFLNFTMFSYFNYIFDIIPQLTALISGFFISALFFSYCRLILTNTLLNKKIRELNALYSISKNISELINLDKILKDVLNEAISAIGARRGSLMLIDEDEQKLEVKVAAGIDGPLSKKILIPIGEGIAGQVFSEAQPIVSNAIVNDERFKNFSEYSENGVKSQGINNILCVPLLISEKKTIGVINIVNKCDDSNFNSDDVKLMETISRHAATLIENSKLYKLATVDGMTGLYVHRYFQVRFKEEFSRAQRYNKNISALMTDIDHFKKFNDTYGHQCGDMVLAHVARIVRDTIRNIDIAARYGGEEFAVALPETDADGAFKLAERIRKNVEDSSCPTPKGDLKVTISIGVACNLAAKSPTHLALIACADSALYKSKENGRNRVSVYEGGGPPLSEDNDDDNN